MKIFYLVLFCFAIILQGCRPVNIAVVSNENQIELMPVDDPIISTELNELKQSMKYRSSFDLYEINVWYDSPISQWNKITRDWVAYYYKNPLQATRIYAMMSVAQQRALDSIAAMNIDFSSRLPEKLDNQITAIEIECLPMECGALIGSAESMLIYLFPETQEQILKQTEEARLALLISGNILPSDLDAAEAIGRDIAQAVIAERLNDGSATAGKSEPLPTGEGIWKPDPFQVSPQGPSWGKVTPWLMESGDQFRPAPPPEYGSAEFLAALDEVYQVQQNVTHEQLAIADYWAGDPGTFTPAGYWNLIASDLVTEYELSSIEAGHVFAAMNMAMMDASIGCWDAKYHYLVVRPWQADERIRGLVGYPNHPSYPSGHSCFSAAGAEVLAFYFPMEEKILLDLAKEASLSRLYGGIHYRFDLDAGLELGKQVAGLYVKFIIEQNWQIKNQ